MPPEGHVPGIAESPSPLRKIPAPPVFASRKCVPATAPVGASRAAGQSRVSSVSSPGRNEPRASARDPQAPRNSPDRRPRAADHHRGCRVPAASLSARRRPTFCRDKNRASRDKTRAGPIARAARSVDLRPSIDSSAVGFRLHLGGVHSAAQARARLLCPADIGRNGNRRSRRSEG